MIPDTPKPDVIQPVPYPNTYWVVANRLLAGEHPVEINAERTQSRLFALLDAGIRTFVDLTEEHEMPGYHRALRNEARNRGIDITYVRIPIHDQSIPSNATLRTILDVLDRSLIEQQPAFVHCFAGLGRTGTTVGCFLKRHKMATASDIMERIAILRSSTPNSIISSPQTEEQIRLVQHWEDKK